MEVRHEPLGEKGHGLQRGQRAPLAAAPEHDLKWRHLTSNEREQIGRPALEDRRIVARWILALVGNERARGRVVGQDEEVIAAAITSAEDQRQRGAVRAEVAGGDREEAAEQRVLAPRPGCTITFESGKVVALEETARFVEVAPLAEWPAREFRGDVGPP